MQVITAASTGFRMEKKARQYELHPGRPDGHGLWHSVTVNKHLMLPRLRKFMHLQLQSNWMSVGCVTLRVELKLYYEGKLSIANMIVYGDVKGWDGNQNQSWDYAFSRQILNGISMVEFDCSYSCPCTCVRDVTVYMSCPRLKHDEIRVFFFVFPCKFNVRMEPEN